MALTGEKKIRSDLAKIYLQKMADPKGRIFDFPKQGLAGSGCFFCLDAKQRSHHKDHQKCQSCHIYPICQNGKNTGILCHLRKYSTFGQLIVANKYDFFKSIIEEIAQTGEWDVEKIVESGRQNKLQYLVRPLKNLNEKKKKLTAKEMV
jgi:hypothetical protein